MQKIRVIFQNNSSQYNSPQFSKVLEYFIEEICNTDSSITELIYLVPTKDFCKYNPKLSLPKLKSINASDITIHKYETMNSIILATHIQYATILKAEELANCRAIIVLPKPNNDLNQWIDSYKPSIINNEGDIIIPDKTLPTILNPIVKETIDILTKDRNDIKHPYDKQEFIKKFKHFVKEDIEFDTSEILIYLITNKYWTIEDAKAVQKLGEDIKKGKVLRSGK